MNFINFKIAVSKQFEMMKEHTLYRTKAQKDEMWDVYISSFKGGTNPIFRVRTEHDCSCCKQFIRAVGNVVANIDGQLVSIWDCDVAEPYKTVASEMSAFVLSEPIMNFFLHDSRVASTDETYEDMDDYVHTWNHFYIRLPQELVMTTGMATHLSKTKAIHDVFKRSLETISVEAIDTVLDLIDSDSLYRGEEHKDKVTIFQRMRVTYDGMSDNMHDRELYCWGRYVQPIRNTVIGTLLVDLSEGRDLEASVKSFEQKIAPENYKRPKSVVTKGMIQKAEAKVIELGFLESLPRRYAVNEDITINNVLFADRSAKRRMGVFEEMIADAPVKINGSAIEIGIADFITNVLPNATVVSLLNEQRLSANQVSLIAPVDRSAPSMLKWSNNFGWVYVGETADSMKQRVKAAGGTVDGIIRFSIEWNGEGDNNIDFDAHCIEPDGNLISYSKRAIVQPSSGVLDVDIIRPRGEVAVENITWSDEAKIQRGKYTFVVHNYSHNRSRRGFTAEIEYDGKIYSYTYDKPLRGNEKIVVALADYDGKSLKITGGLPSVANATEATPQKVAMIMYSPNHWDGQGVGNKHYFFMLGGAKREGEARGFFNEFLQESLTEHRKVFEVLGSKMRAPATDDQLTGLGFSSTKRNHVNVIVDGKPMKVII